MVSLVDLGDKKVGLQNEFQRVAAIGGVFIIFSFKHSYTPLNLNERIKFRILIILNFPPFPDTVNFHHLFGSIES